MSSSGLVDEEVFRDSFLSQDHRAATSTETMSHEEYALLLIRLHLEVMYALHK